MKHIIKILLILLIPATCHAQVDDIEGDSKEYLNQQLTLTEERLRTVENYTLSSFSGVLALANGGTGQALVDPGTDRIGFWDESEDEFTWLTLGTGLSISGDTVSVSLANFPNYTTGSVIESAAATEVNSNETSYTKAKEFSPVIRGGTVTVAFDLKTGNSSYTAYGKIYKNGSPAGNEHTTTDTAYTEYSDNISVSVGDVLTVYCKIADSATDYYIKDFEIRAASPTQPVEIN